MYENYMYTKRQWTLIFLILILSRTTKNSCELAEKIIDDNENRDIILNIGTYVE